MRCRADWPPTAGSLEHHRARFFASSDAHGTLDAGTVIGELARDEHERDVDRARSRGRLRAAETAFGEAMMRIEAHGRTG